MTDRQDRNRSYDVHGDGLDSVRDGLAIIGVPENRRAAAVEILREVLDANGAIDLRWYRTDGKDELVCYWEGTTKNVLWITPSNVHVRAVPEISRPVRSLDWEGRDGELVGWLLPGAESGDGGGTRPKPVAEARCPETFLLHPAGSICPTCEIVHELL